MNPYVEAGNHDREKDYIYLDQGNQDPRNHHYRTQNLSKQGSVGKESVQKSNSRTGVAQNDHLSASFGNTQGQFNDRDEHSFKGNENLKVSDDYSRQQGNTGQYLGYRNSKEGERYQDHSRRTGSGQRGTNETDENLFQYSATNDRLQEDDRMASYDREDTHELHDYMSSQQRENRRNFDSEVYNKLKSDIIYSKERPDVGESRASAFETANKLLKSKIIGHLTHHQGKVEQIADISKRVPDSTMAYSRGTEQRTLHRPAQNQPTPNYSAKGDASNSRNKGWAYQQSNNGHHTYA